MENKINVAELLKKCPTGMKLDCALFDDGMEFVEVRDNDSLPIYCRTKDSYGTYNFHYLTKYGCWFNEDNANCVIFPKGETTWENFTPPVTFQNGDIIVKGRYIVIVWYIKSNGVVYYHGCYDIKYADVKIMKDCGIGTIYDNCVVRLATEEEKQRLFDAFKKIGVKWNTDKKMLEKIVEPIFKKGDKVKRKDVNYTHIVTIVRLDGDYYDYVNADGQCGVIYIDEQDKWELVSDNVKPTFKDGDTIVEKDACLGQQTTEKNNIKNTGGIIMKKYEYQQVEYNNYPSAEELNEEGMNGWELIQILHTKKTYYDSILSSYLKKDVYIATFKRESLGM